MNNILVIIINCRPGISRGGVCATRLLSYMILIMVIIVISYRLFTQDCAQQSSSSSWAVCTPYRPGGLFDHVPRRTLEQGCVFGNGFVASCGVPCGGTACLQIVEATGYAYYILLSHRAPVGLCHFRFHPPPPRHPLPFYTLYAMIPLLDTPGRGSSLRLKEGMRNTSVH